MVRRRSSATHHPNLYPTAREGRTGRGRDVAPRRRSASACAHGAPRWAPSSDCEGCASRCPWSRRRGRRSHSSGCRGSSASSHGRQVRRERGIDVADAHLAALAGDVERGGLHPGRLSRPRAFSMHGLDVRVLTGRIIDPAVEPCRQPLSWHVPMPFSPATHPGDHGGMDPPYPSRHRLLAWPEGVP